MEVENFFYFLKFKIINIQIKYKLLFIFDLNINNYCYEKLNIHFSVLYNIIL